MNPPPFRLAPPSVYKALSYSKFFGYYFCPIFRQFWGRGAIFAAELCGVPPATFGAALSFCFWGFSARCLLLCLALCLALLVSLELGYELS